MNVYVRELVSALAQAGRRLRRLRPPLARRPARRWSRSSPGFRVRARRRRARPTCAKEDLPDGRRRLRPTGVRRPHHRAAATSTRIHANYWLSGVAGHALKHELDLPLVSTFHTLARVKAETGDPEPERRVDAEAEVIALLRRDPRVLHGRGRPARAALRRRPRAHRDRAARRRPRLLLARRPRRRPRGARPRPRRPARCCCSSGRIQPLKGLDVAVARARRAAPPATPCSSWSAGPAGRTARPSSQRVHGLVAELGRGGPGPLRPPAAPPPAVDLLPGRRRLRGAEPVGVVRARGPRGGGVRHAGGRGRRRRAAPPSSTTADTGFLVEGRDPAGFADAIDAAARRPAPGAGHGERGRGRGPVATRGRPRPPACAASTPTSPTPLVDCA